MVIELYCIPELFNPRYQNQLILLILTRVTPLFIFLPLTLIFFFFFSLLPLAFFWPIHDINSTRDCVWLIQKDIKIACDWTIKNEKIVITCELGSATTCNNTRKEVIYVKEDYTSLFRIEELEQGENLFLEVRN